MYAIKQIRFPNGDRDKQGDYWIFEADGRSHSHPSASAATRFPSYLEAAAKMEEMNRNLRHEIWGVVALALGEK